MTRRVLMRASRRAALGVRLQALYGAQGIKSAHDGSAHKTDFGSLCHGSNLCEAANAKLIKSIGCEAKLLNEKTYKVDTRHLTDTNAVFLYKGTASLNLRLVKTGIASLIRRTNNVVLRLWGVPNQKPQTLPQVLGFALATGPSLRRDVQLDVVGSENHQHLLRKGFLGMTKEINDFQNAEYSEQLTKIRAFRLIRWQPTKHLDVYF